MSVVMPFAGDSADAAEALEALSALQLRAGDEVIVADNTPELVLGEAATGRVRTVRAARERSSYHARNAGAAAARNEWLLFLDSDCRPPGDLLDRYFDPPPGDEVGAVAGEVLGLAGQDSLVARYAVSREILSQRNAARHHYRPLGVTANMLVRREAWQSIGGFSEGIRSGGDSDFSWRIQEAGWGLGLDEGAAVEHVHRESLRPFVRQMVRYGNGQAWLNRRHPGSQQRPRPVRAIVRAVGAGAVWTVKGDLDRARFKALDAAAAVAQGVGYFGENRPSEVPRAGGGTPIAVLVDGFPSLSETFVTNEIQALRSQGYRVRVESIRRDLRGNPDALDGLAVDYMEDDGGLRRVRDLAWLVMRAPLGVLRDVLGRRRWRAQEEVVPLRMLAPAVRRSAFRGDCHLHVHFAATAALNGLRAGRLLGTPCSVTAHAYEIFKRPQNLELKLSEATFATSGCEYNVRFLRGLVPAPSAERIHKIVMGVDPERFTRSELRPREGTVLAIGRLVEKKGFEHLVEAVAASERVDSLSIIGEGPLREHLESRIAELGIGDRIELVGARDEAGVRAALEEASVLAMPCVVAGNGDRDSMPVVVKEALAMQVPVVASDEVGLPELVRPEFGRLVPPGDPDALAVALDEVLALSPEERARMGVQGRRWVEEHANVHRETRKLASLIEEAIAGA